MNVRKAVLASLFICATYCSNAQVLFTYGSGTVTKEDFLRAYNKNNTNVPRSAASVKEYLDLYTKFKLKVKAAEEAHLDTVEQLKYDLQSFRSQIQDGYLTDDKLINDLTAEAFMRSQKDIRVRDIYVQLREDMTPDDTLAAYQRIQEAYQMLVSGNKDYKQIVALVNKDAKANVKQADFGYITAFSIPYDYETIVYKLKPGSFAKPFRGKSAWHIFINEAERAPFGKWRVAQILFTLPPNPTPAQTSAIQQKADSIYQRLLAGEDFSALAKKYSEDRFTFSSGGEIKEFGTGKFSPDFEEHVLQLKNDGDIAKPFSSPNGIHILKRLQQIPQPTDQADETNMYAVKQMVANSDRAKIAQRKFVEEVTAKVGVKISTVVPQSVLFKMADSVVATSDEIKTAIDNKDILQIGKSHVKGIEWLQYIRQYKSESNKSAPSTAAYFQNFVDDKVMVYYTKHLEEYNADFRYQLQEFKEGNMLFEIMERNVWSKAVNDSAGLQEHYVKNKNKYLWAESADVLIYNCSNENVAAAVMEKIKKGILWNKIIEEGEGTVQADSGRYEISQLQILSNQKVAPGFISPVSVNDQDKTTTFVQVLNVYPAGQQRSFDEAKGLVINEYQTELEEKWIEELKKKYPVKINQKELNSLLK